MALRSLDRWLSIGHSHSFSLKSNRRTIQISDKLSGESNSLLITNNRIIQMELRWYQECKGISKWQLAYALVGKVYISISRKMESIFAPVELTAKWSAILTSRPFHSNMDFNNAPIKENYPVIIKQIMESQFMANRIKSLVKTTKAHRIPNQRSITIMAKVMNQKWPSMAQWPDTRESTSQHVVSSSHLSSHSSIWTNRQLIKRSTKSMNWSWSYSNRRWRALTNR